MWRIQLEAKPDWSLRDQILVPLDAHNTAEAGPGGWEQFAITVRDADDTVVGGLHGRVGYGFLFVEILALGPAKGGGRGRQVMELAEAEARRRGLLGIWLDTWTFQAPGFYKKLGFEEFGRIAEYPPGHDRIFLVKRLTG